MSHPTVGSGCTIPVVPQRLKLPIALILEYGDVIESAKMADSAFPMRSQAGVASWDD